MPAVEVFSFQSGLKGTQVDSLKGYERVTLLNDKPISITRSMQQVLLNEKGSIRAVNESGTIVIQTKKLKGNVREVARINTAVIPATIEFAIEEITE